MTIYTVRMTSNVDTYEIQVAEKVTFGEILKAFPDVYNIEITATSEANNDLPSLHRG